ncbi:MAG: FkbM family methyltransferase, partial [Clostridia bacterium]|nr:FkbM family methyltransferase [Clostridia bacterium]
MTNGIIKGLTPLIDSLREEKRPVFLYGMGNGAEKVFEYLTDKGIGIKGVVASDAFVRGQSFLGHRVKTIREAEEEYGKLCLALCFGLEEDRHEFLDPPRERGHRIVSPNLPVYGEGCLDADFIKENADRFDRLFDMLADAASKEVLSSVLRYCYTGDPDHLEIANAGDAPSGFYRRKGIHIDVGAYDGDTVKEFISAKGEDCGKIFAFEPDPYAFRKLKAGVGSLEGVTCVNSAVGGKNGEVNFSFGKGRATSADQSGRDVSKCVTVDGFFGFNDISSSSEPVGTIKIDAEGMDEEVICGAANTLYCCKTSVCTAVYHRADDLINLPF